MSNLFTQVEFMPGASKEEFYAAAEKNIFSLLATLTQLPDLEDTAKIGLICQAMKLGVMDDGVLGQDEEEMITEVCSRVAPGLGEVMLEIMKQDDSLDSAFGALSLLALLGNLRPAAKSVVMDFANVVLPFAYIDGKFDEECSQRLSDIVSSSFNVFAGSPEDFLNSLDSSDDE